ncbi:MAG: hypothetical protein PHQ77_11900, partial [Proteiniphilum sp.]|nr:hypothetical protein [Proteiniphilum sp.]
MKPLVFISSLFAITSMGVFGQESLKPQINFRQYASSADLVYKTPVSTSEEGLPIGNGVMGTLQWTTPTSIRYQLNR